MRYPKINDTPVAIQQLAIQLALQSWFWLSFSSRRRQHCLKEIADCGSRAGHKQDEPSASWSAQKHENKNKNKYPHINGIFKRSQLKGWENCKGDNIHSYLSPWLKILLVFEFLVVEICTWCPPITVSKTYTKASKRNPVRKMLMGLHKSLYLLKDLAREYGTRTLFSFPGALQFITPLAVLLLQRNT